MLSNDAKWYTFRPPQWYIFRPPLTTRLIVDAEKGIPL